MRFLQIHTFYPQYLESLYSRFKYLHKASFQEQIDVLVSDAFSAVHMIAPYMSQVGYESRLVIANCHQAQNQWLKENSSYGLHTENWIEEIVRKQVEEFEPDILYLSHPIGFDGRFVRKLTHKPKLVLGWRAATFPHNIDWSGFDVMLSSLRPLLDLAVQRGVRHGEVFTPGFPVNIAERIKETTVSNDIVFTGQYTPSQHAKRGYYLREIAKTANAKGYKCALHLTGNQSQVPAVLKQYLSPPVYGLEMHKALRQGRIAFDARADHFILDPEKNSKIDIGGEDTANMRIFEATGSGVFLLTEHFPNVTQYFDVGREIETFADRKELVEKIDYYLAHSEKREEIAAQGQARCLKDHSMDRRVQELDLIIRKHLALKNHEMDADRNIETDFSHQSYQQHAAHFARDLVDEKRIAISRSWFNTSTADYWRHERMYEFADCLVGRRNSNWLTVGDGRWGLDSVRLRNKGYTNVLPSDISEHLLKASHAHGYIEKYAVQNAEDLSFDEASFDFVLCKESLHHFPRPYVALYEMLRVARIAVFLIEPNDKRPVLKNILQFVREFEQHGKARFQQPKNPSWEESGNYVFSISPRELEKITLGLNYPQVVYKGLNDHYIQGCEFEPADPESSEIFRNILTHIAHENERCASGDNDYELLMAGIFKQPMCKQERNEFNSRGWVISDLPRNPYAKATK
ncbi:glycosyltransferase family protein [Desulfoplanes sp. PS50]